MKLKIIINTDAETCPNLSQPHPNECNKYMKCIKTQLDVISWISMQCQEGLVYDLHLRSCAIPGNEWECVNDKNSGDNFENSNQDEFLEVIDENLAISNDEQSGDGEVPENFTPSTATSRMITTQLQRLTQLMKQVSDQNNGVVDDEISPADLNKFLAVQNIQSNYQKIDFHTDDKTKVPSSGRIHPEILNDIIDQQTQLNSDANQLTTLSMDETTQKIPQRNTIRNTKKDPITEIRLKAGLSSDGIGSHQIVVNRPEGSVLFNVPSPVSSKQQPYLSEDILKTILEISKQMTRGNHVVHENPQSYAPQPFYYAVPIPVISPQNNLENYFRNTPNNLTNNSIVSMKKKPQPDIFEANHYEKLNADSLDTSTPKSVNSFVSLQSQKSPQTFPYFQNPSFYYQNYPQYAGYQNFQQYPYNYQYPQSQNRFDYSQQQSNFDGSYGNRPFVFESSAPSYVDHPTQPKPYRKESYTTSYENNDDEEVSDSGSLYDEIEMEDEETSAKIDLVCSVVIARQANKTDCFRYYVCNSKTNEVLSYTCPLFTAFNDQTKFCDSQSYKTCKQIKDSEQSILKNQKIYNEAHAALEKLKKESQKVESMVRKETQKMYNRRTNYQTFYQEPVQTNNFLKTQIPRITQTTQHVENYFEPAKLARPTKKSLSKRKKIKCHDVGNIADPESNSSYWHCFRGNDGRMKRINRKCNNNFIFCQKSTKNFCTSKSRCT